MEIVFTMIGLLIGITVTYYFIKSKYTSKSEIERILVELNSTSTNLSVAQEKFNMVSKELIQVKENLGNKEIEVTKLITKNASKETSLTNISEKVDEEKEKNVILLKERDNLGIENRELVSKLSELTANNKSLNEKLLTQKEEIQDIRKTSQIEFENIANRILKVKASEFTERNKTNIDAILKPLNDNIKDFKKQVNDAYTIESNQRFSLEKQVKELIEQTNKVSGEANNLATALKGQSKTQGNWGEVILESILERSGLLKDREYFVQKTISDSEGKRIRPDILVNLPGKRTIIIDSKMSLVDYDKFCSANTKEDQDIYFKRHMDSIYKHIDNLSGKKYDDLETSLDFTMMFIPIEPAFLMAIKDDQELWSYGYSKRILLISPTNLIACLKLIEDLWKREMQNKNAMEIVKRGELLYEKFVGFVESMKDIGKNIADTQNSYESALGQLRDGRGNLIEQAIKLRELGPKSSKEIPENMLPFTIDIENSK